MTYGRWRIRTLLAEASRRSGIYPAQSLKGGTRGYPMGELSSRILEACKTPQKFADICKHVDRIQQQVGTPLRRLVAQGKLIRVERGVYVTPPVLGEDRT